MLILLPILLLFLASLVMLAIRLARPDFVYHWLIAMVGALAAWILTLVAGRWMPQTIPLISSQAGVLFPGWASLLVDRLSWPFAVALTTLILAVILTDVARAPEADWNSWASCLALGGAGLLAVLAGNPSALLLAWMAIDLGELLIFLGQVKQSAARERIVVAFSARMMGSIMLLAAGIVARANTGNVLAFAVIPPRAGLLLLLAAGLRLGVLPLQMPFLQDLPLRRGLGTMARLTPAAAAFVLLTRTATAEQITPLAPYLLALSGIAALYSGVTWATAANELDGRPAWILGTASLAVGAALRGQPLASLAWGLASILSGGLLFLTSIRDRRLQWFTLLGLWGVSALPFSPAWNGARLFVSPFQPVLILFWPAQALLLAGYTRHALRSGRSLSGVERWVWLIYPLGLGLLFLIHLLSGFWVNPGIEALPAAMWWAGFASLTLFLGLLALIQRGMFLPRQAAILRSALSFSWLYGLLWAIYRSLGRLIKFLTEVLEGEGGVLWALLILVILFLTLSRPGG